MPIPYEKAVCFKCWKPKLFSFNPRTQKTELALDISMMIIINPNGTNEKINICSNHLRELKLWLINSQMKLPRQVSDKQERLS